MSWEVVSCWIEGHPGLASWVQAIGSILAIGAAGLFPFVHERAKEKRLRRNTLKSLLHLSVSLRDLQLRIKDSLANDGRNLRWLKGDGPAELNEIGQLISELPASLFVGFEMACLSDMRICAGFAQQMHSIIVLSKSSQINGIYDMNELINSNQSKIEQIDQVINYLGSNL